MAAGTGMYLKLNGIEGNCTDDKHANWIDVQHWTHAISNNSEIGVSGQGGGVGRASHHGYNVTAINDKVGPQVGLRVVTGQHITDGVLEIWIQGDKTGKVLNEKHVLKDILVQNVSSGRSGGERGTLSFTLSCGEVEWEFHEQDKAGATKKASRVAMNVKTGVHSA